MNQFADRFKENARETFAHMGVYLVRLFTGTLLGLTIALTAQNMVELSHLMFVFVVMLTAALVIRITRHWGILSVLILMLVLALLGVLLKLYIHTSAAG
mgnify:CR=1 FL=1